MMTTERHKNGYVTIGTDGQGEVYKKDREIVNRNGATKTVGSATSKNMAAVDTNLTNGKMPNGHIKMTRNCVRPASNSVKNTARNIAVDIIHYTANNNSNLKSSDQHSQTMRRTVDELSERHEILFKSMVSKLDLNKDNIKETFENISDEVFKDNHYNWGRIVSVYAFGGRMAKYCAENNMENCVEDVALFVGDYVSDRLCWWVEQQGAWDAFDEYFPEPKSFEDKIWKGLLVTAFGLGALATMVAAR